ncbi:MAG: hydroxyisourate hydrolase [Trebonia sp.]
MTVSTHVLDASAGVPAAGVSVSLSGPAGAADLDSALASGTTGADGRLRFAAETPPGVYRLTFATGEYFARRGVPAFYPEVVVTFTVPAGEHCHVPLLLSPFSYSTYRGG